MSGGLVSVLIPVHDEERTVEQVIRRVTELPFESEIVVVDDGSHDSTPQILQRLVQDGVPGLRVYTQPRNLGKGAAIRTAIGHSRGDVVVIQDADLEYDPKDLPRLIEPIVEGHADTVFGTRLRGGAAPQRAHMFWHYVGNRVLSLCTNVLYNTTISDMEVGYKAFRGDLIRSMHLVANGFDFEPEVTAKLLRRRDVRLYEVPIAYYGRTYAEGKHITWRDGFAALWTLVRWRVRS